MLVYWAYKKGARLAAGPLPESVETDPYVRLAY